MYHYHNTKHVHVPLGTPNMNGFFQDIGLPGYFNVETSNLHLIVFLFKYDGGESAFTFEQRIIILVHNL